MKAAATLHHHQVHHVPAPAVSWRLHFVFEYLLALPLGAALALVWANLAPESYYPFTYSIAFFVNEIAMVFFFGLITKEIVEATAPGGIFHPWHRITVPVAASLGSVLAAFVIYELMLRVLGAPMLTSGWPVLFATDLAFAYFVARMIFGRHPAVTFLLLTAIAANGFGFIALAVWYPVRDVHAALAGILMITALAIAGGLRVARVKTFWPYVIFGGGFSWLALIAGGFHAAFALVPIMFFLPHLARDPGFFVDARPNAHDALDRFEIWCRVPAQVALFLFGLVNAGVPFHAIEEGQWAAPIAMLAGKPLGVLAVVGLAAALGWHVPKRLGWRELLVVGIISGIGFTLALFFASTVFPAGQLLSETKVGTLLTVAGAAIAFGSAALHKVGRFAR
jgi:Na+:H+ antiporter, NhaA family